MYLCWWMRLEDENETDMLLNQKAKVEVLKFFQ